MDNEQGYLDEESVRKRKVKDLFDKNINPYPSTVKSTFAIRQACANFKEISKKEEIIFLIGRIRTLRRHGGSTFAHIQDESGKIQIYFKKDLLGEEKYKLLAEYVDAGDFIETEGSLFMTHMGEKTLLAKNFRLICKAVKPLPEKWHGLVDTEMRYRNRPMDLLSNPETMDIFKKRAEIIKTLRDFLNENGFMEVETPMLQKIPGGATARPFETYHNVLDEKMYLRVAPELYLKKLIVGGFERVYELGRCFRNEGVDWSHNPEFTMLEFYAAYWDYRVLMKFTENLFYDLLVKSVKKAEIEYKKQKINFTPPYDKIKFKDAVLKESGIDLDQYATREELAKEAKKKGVKVENIHSFGKIMDEIYKDFVRPKLIKPTFIMDLPVELSPLAKKIPDNPRYTERFQLVAAGFELCNCFSELNDPEDQLFRFKEQEKLRQQGDFEAQRIDYDYIENMKLGLPPTAGFGMGIDRLVALITDSPNLKEVILFPTLKSLK